MKVDERVKLMSACIEVPVGCGELSTASMYITIGAILELVIKMHYFIFPKVIKRRKLIIVTGLYSISALWIMMLFLYISE